MPIKAKMTVNLVIFILLSLLLATRELTMMYSDLFRIG